MMITPIAASRVIPIVPPPVTFQPIIPQRTVEIAMRVDQVERPTFKRDRQMGTQASFGESQSFANYLSHYRAIRNAEQNNKG